MKRFNKDSTRVEKRKDREYYKNVVEKWVINQKEVTEERQREREIIGRGQYRTAKRQVKKKKKKQVEEMKKLKKSDRRREEHIRYEPPTSSELR